MVDASRVVAERLSIVNSKGTGSFDEAAHDRMERIEKDQPYNP